MLYLLTALLIIQDQLILALLLVLLCTYYRSAAWFIPLGFLVDGYFGAFFGIPMFSIVAILWYAISELLRPRIRVAE